MCGYARGEVSVRRLCTGSPQIATRIPTHPLPKSHGFIFIFPLFIFQFIVNVVAELALPKLGKASFATTFFISHMKLKLLVPILFLLVSCHKEAPLAPQSIGTVTSVEGEVLIARTITGPFTMPAAPSMALYQKDTIETKTGKIKLALADGSTIALSDNSKIILNEFVIEEKADFRKSKIGMTGGQLRSVVSKHFSGAGSEVNIETPTVVAGVRGTELAVTAEADKSSVYCLDGEVEVFKPTEPQVKRMVTKDMFVAAEAAVPIEEPRPIPPELRKALFEEGDFVPPDFRDRIRTFEAEYEAKKAEMKAREMQMKQKMEDKKKAVQEKMKDNQDRFNKKAEDKKSEMDKKREEMLKKMKDKMKKPGQ